MGNYSLDMTPLIQQTLGWAALGLVLALLLLPRGLRRRDIRIFGLLSAAAVMGTAFLTLYCNEAAYRRTTAGSELVNPWSDTEVFVSHGVLYPFLYSYFTSTNPAAATVNECGEITAHAVGTAVITAVSEAGNIKANCKVTVVQKKAETITGKDDEKTPDRKPDTQSSIKVGKVSIKSVKKKKASPTVTITLARKVSKASGYQIKVYPTSGKAKKNKGAITTKFITKNTKKLVVKNKKLKNKKRCYVRIRRR